MVAKKEIVEQIQELLGTELGSLKRMTKKDLMKLVNLLVEPVNLVQIGIRDGKPKTLLKGLQLLVELGEKKK